MLSFKRILLVVAFSFCVAPQTHATTLLGPLGGSGLSGEYASASDSPFNGIVFSAFYLDDFEDGLLNTPGVTASSGQVGDPGLRTDSVDSDDGTMDGFGADGYSYWSGYPNPTGVTFSFDETILGALPTHAGLVITDSVVNTTVEFFDQLGASIAVFGPLNVRISLNTATDGDRFVGVVSQAGISAIHISDTGIAFEVDHLQYGVSASPNTLTLQEIITAIDSVDLGFFKNSNMQNILTKKINIIIELVEQDNYTEALDNLQNFVLEKVDGCAASDNIDNNDWIQDCESQDIVYPLIIEAIGHLESM